MNSNRNMAFDMMKGVGIILVIVGHLAHGYGLAPIIYVFHMPLFFIVSGYFYKPKQPLDLLKRDAKLLLLPYCLVAFLILMYGATMAFIRYDISKLTLIGWRLFFTREFQSQPSVRCGFCSQCFGAGCFIIC